jgi:hypothetical protein
MANPNAPFGFRLWRHGAGGTGGRTTEYALSTGYSTALYQGDLVKLDGSGAVNIAAAGDQVVGVFGGVNYIFTDGSVQFRRNWTASTTEKSGTIIRAIVFDDPMQLFLAQSTGSMTAADIGQWVDVDTGTAGSSLTGISGQQTSADGGSESTFRVMDVIGLRHNMPCRNSAGNPDFFATGTNALVVVKIMKHTNFGVATTEV